MDRDKVVLAEILRPRGIRGELVARSQTDVPGRLAGLKKAQVLLRDGSSSPVELEAAWEHKGGWVLKFSGVDSIETAERYRGADLWVHATERAKLGEGEYFQSDLIGCRLVDLATGECVGEIKGWQEYGGPPLMEVLTGGREQLVPFVSSLCQVDLDARTIRMDLPEGLLEL